MAGFNSVHLKGIIIEDPREIVIGEKKCVQINVLTARSSRKMEENGMRLVTDEPSMIASSPKMKNNMMEFKKGDVISVNGVITTGKVKKSNWCPVCGKDNAVDGTITYITPIFIEKIREADTEEEITEYLTEVRHFSNEVSVLGRLTKPPKRVRVKSKMFLTQYQIALRRKYIIKEDPPELRADYPYVKSYGEEGEEDWLRLKEGSIVFIDGYLQTRNVLRHATCDVCGEKYDWYEKVDELMPFSTEYLHNYRSDEEVELLREERLAQSEADKVGVISDNNQ